MNKNGMIIAVRYAKAWLACYSMQLQAQDIPKLYALAQVLVQQGNGSSTQQLASALQEFSCSSLLEKMVALLQADKRLFLLPLVLRAIADYALCTKNISYMTLESSHPLTKQERDKVADWAAQQIHTTIIYQYNVNPQLMAGIAMYSNTYAWERSVRKALSPYALLMSSGVLHGN